MARIYFLGKGLRDCDIVLERLKIQRQEQIDKKAALGEWAENYDKIIGPMQSTYGNNVDGIKNIYNNAKKFHKEGIQLLKDEFGYHPEFKRPGDTFTASPWQPK